MRAAVVRQALQRGQLPPPVLPPGVPGHAPLDLGPQERVQAAEVDLRRPHHRRGRRAPPAESRRRRTQRARRGRRARSGCPTEMAGPPRRGFPVTGCAPRAGGTAPAARTPSQGRRGRGSGRSRQLAPGRPATGRSRCRHRAGPGSDTSGTDGNDTAAGPGGRPDGPGISGTAVPLPPRQDRPAPRPAGSQPASRPRRGASATAFRGHGTGRRAPSWPLAVPRQAVPPVNGMAGRDLDDVRAEQRIGRRRADQRGQDLQPVPARAGAVLPEGHHGHLASPQAVRRAASKAGSCTRRARRPHQPSPPTPTRQRPGLSAGSRRPHRGPPR